MKCENHGPSCTMVQTAGLLCAMLLYTDPLVKIHGHGPLGWTDYTGGLCGVEREDGSGKSFNVKLNIGGNYISVYCRFK